MPIVAKEKPVLSATIYVSPLTTSVLPSNRPRLINVVDS